MLLKAGDKIHVMVRRRFENDLRRHFIGEVIESTENAIKASGYVFVLDFATNQYLRRPELRIRIVSLLDAGNIINILPQNARIDKVSYKLSDERHLIVTDQKTFSLDINEFGSKY